MAGRPDLIKSAAARAEREDCARALEGWAVLPKVDAIARYTLRLAAQWIRQKRLSTTRNGK